jgi:chromosome segregation ATPase
MSTGEQPIRIKDVYEIAERLEDKFDRRFEEIRASFETFRTQIERIDREGAIGTRAKLVETDRQLDDLDQRMTLVEGRPVVRREELHELKGEIAALKLWQAGLTAVAMLKKSQVAVALALFGVFAGLIGSVATLVWLNHG